MLNPIDHSSIKSTLFVNSGFSQSRKNIIGGQKERKDKKSDTGGYEKADYTEEEEEFIYRSYIS